MAVASPVASVAERTIELPKEHDLWGLSLSKGRLRHGAGSSISGPALKAGPFVAGPGSLTGRLRPAVELRRISERPHGNRGGREWVPQGNGEVAAASWPRWSWPSP